MADNSFRGGPKWWEPWVQYALSLEEDYPEVPNEIVQFLKNLILLNWEEWAKKSVKSCGVEPLQIASPKALYKMLYVFRYPTELIPDASKILFTYVFEYKRNYFEVRDRGGKVEVEFFAPLGKEEADMDVVREFVRLMKRFLEEEKIPLWFDGMDTWWL